MASKKDAEDTYYVDQTTNSDSSFTIGRDNHGSINSHKGTFNAPVITNMGEFGSEWPITNNDFENEVLVLRQENNLLKKEVERLKNELLKEKERLIISLLDKK